MNDLSLAEQLANADPATLEACLASLSGDQSPPADIWSWLASLDDDMYERVTRRRSS
jgi:hypothetical protein